MKKRLSKASKTSENDNSGNIIELLAMLHYISSVFLVIFGFMIVVISSFFWASVSGLVKIPVGFMIIIALFILIFGVFQFFVASGLLRKELWSKTAALVLGILMLFGFPIGTFIGIVTIYFLVFNKKVRRRFR